MKSKDSQISEENTSTSPPRPPPSSPRPPPSSLYLPPDLCSLIIPRLPVKSILKFRCVCKSWCSFIDHPDFITTHHNLNNNGLHNKNTTFLAIEHLGAHELKGSSLTLRSANKDDPTMKTITPLFKTSETHFAVASCDGLLLVRRLNSSELSIWNVSIRKRLKVPPCPLAPPRRVKYIFGYLPWRGDYLLYAFQRHDYRAPETVVVAVYGLREGVWRVWKCKMDVPMWVFDAFPVAIGGESCVFIKDTLHWLGNDQSSGSSSNTEFTKLVSFDFEAEEFSFLDLPVSPEIQTFRYLFRLGESLALFTISSECRCVWVLEKPRGEGSWQWKLWFSRDSSEIDFKCFKVRGRSVRRFLCVDNVGEVLVCEKFSYNIMTDRIIKCHSSHGMFFIDYKESMVFHKGCQGQSLKSLP